MRAGRDGRRRGDVRIRGKGSYRGKLRVKASGGGLLVTNVVGLDDYVMGVVANEMPSSWSQPALRAQAVAARSFALVVEPRRGLRRLRRHAKPGLQRKGHRETRAPTGPCRRTKRPDPPLPRAGRHRLLLLELGRSRPRAISSPSRRRPIRVPAERQGPLRRDLAGPHVAGRATRRARWSPASRACSRAGCGRSRC